MKKKTKITIVVTVFMVAIGAVCGWYFGIKQPYDKAYADYLQHVTTYNEAVQSLNVAIGQYDEKANKIDEANQLLDKAISEARQLIGQGEDPYDPDILDSLSKKLDEGESSKITTKTMVESNPINSAEEDGSTTKQLRERSKTMAEVENSLWLERDRVLEQIKELPDPDYSAIIRDIQQGQTDLKHSIAVKKQITNPPETLVIGKLQTISDIAGIAPATEDNDPNGNLNKAGGYTAAVFFDSPLVPRGELLYNDILENGTEGGGCVEVYANEEDAHKRNDYLANFDGPGFLNPGSHAVLGTMVIRTSWVLKASHQNQLEQAIIDAMLMVD